MQLASRSPRCGSATTVPGSRNCWPPSPRWRPAPGGGVGRGHPQLRCGARRGKGKSDPIGARLAVLAALRLDTSRLAVPRADGDREALRILLVARQEITEACNAQAGRLRALLLTGDDTDCGAARTALSGKPLPP